MSRRRWEGGNVKLCEDGNCGPRPARVVQASFLGRGEVSSERCMKLVLISKRSDSVSCLHVNPAASSRS